MKRGRIAPMMLLVLCLALVLSIVPTSVFATQTTEEVLTGTELTASHAGTTLQAGEYYVAPDTTLKLTGGTGKSGLKVADGATVTIYIPANSKLYVTGGAASGTTGAGAGIEVNIGSTLKITGAGELYAYGGKAANGSNGANGDAADWVDDGRSYIPDGGYGGAGGGGAGAGIGTKGGAGGSGTGWTLGFSSITNRYQDTEGFVNTNISGRRGSNGGNGASATACGAIYISNDIKYTAAGGAQGTSGGSGGSRGSYDYESDNHWMRGLAGGAGGGGGGAGKAGASIGTGGGGGGGGGAGGGVGYAWSYQFLGAGGGGGGAGAVGGSGGAWGYDGTVPDCKQFQYFNGKQLSSTSGSSGGTSSGGSGGQGAKVKITDWSGKTWQYPYGGTGGTGGAAGANSSTVEVKKLYRVSLVVEDETIGVYNASANEFLPANIAVPEKAGYTFQGFYADDLCYYDVAGQRTTEKITGHMTIYARFEVNSYSVNLESVEGSNGGADDVSGPVEYGQGITLTTPRRDGYLFRGWKISAINGTINQDAYYTYTASARARTVDQLSADFIYENGVAVSAGFEKIGDSITVYNLSADDDAQIKIEEMWERNSFTVTFKDFDGTVLGSPITGGYGTDVTAPSIPNHQNDYYTYTFCYWKCNIDGQYYTTAELPFLGYFVDQEGTKGKQVYDDVTFTAVYAISEYKKELKLVGSLGNENLTDDVLVLEKDSVGAEVITNFVIEKNDGVAALLLLPEYDANVFSIKAISVNGQLKYGTGAASETVLNGFDVTITGGTGEPMKILLDNITPDDSTGDQIFIQIVYVMKSVVGGKYEFGFVTKMPEYTDKITHGDRSEAYGTYDPDADDDTDAYKFNELNITVDASAINVVIRVDGEITIADNQSFVYNGQQMSAADITEMIERALQYTYNGFEKKDENTLTIKWYDANGAELSAAPTSVGTYQIGISAAETAYYSAVEQEVRATFTITPYEVVVTAGNQSFAYTGSNIVLDTSAAGAGLYIRDEQGNLVPVDDFVNNDITLTGVQLTTSCINAGTYPNVIQGAISGNLDNYTVVYENGTLTITKAENSWVGFPKDKTVEYSGSSVAIEGAQPAFGTIKVEYLVGYEKNENGDDVPVWTTVPPTDAGTYPVKVTVTGNDNYSDLEYEVTLIITKQVISAGDISFTAVNKYYNGEFQYWSTDPNGDNSNSDTEVTLNSTILDYIKFVGILNPNNCKNAGTYTIQAMIQITNPNYTFVSDKGEVDSWTCDVEAEILPCDIYVVVGDQSAEYSGSEPAVNQGQGYVTITIQNGTTPDFVILDFFGGEVYVTAGNTFDDQATYYQLVDKVYQMVVLTQEEFDNNQAKANTEGFVQYYVLTSMDAVETLILQKAEEGVDAGQYPLTAVLGSLNSNYHLVSVTDGVFTITKKLIAIPTLESVPYNGQLQSPAVADDYTDVYQLVGAGKDANVYQITATLLDKTNYAWMDVEASAESDDVVLDWYITKKIITLVYNDAEQPYEYGISKDEILTALGTPTWKDGDGPVDGDTNTNPALLYVFYSQNDNYPQVGQHVLQVSPVQGYFNPNYQVKIEGGNVEIIKKTLTQDELKARILAAIKDYTGEALELDASSDFQINLFDYNNRDQAVFYVTAVNTNGHVNANGYMEGSEFVPYDNSEITVSVTVALADAVAANYQLADGADTFDVQAYIAKAMNSWVSGPMVDATNIANVTHSAESRFAGSAYDVTFYTDKECKNPVSQFDANATYYAKFVVEGNNNYYKLETVIVFSGSYITVIKPVVTLEGTVVGSQVTTITYDGKVHTFYVPESEHYTVTVEPTGDWKNVGEYKVIIALKDENHKWDDASSNEITYTLQITPKTLSITAENKQITYGDPVPEYVITADGLVDGETLENLLGNALASYISCDYQQNSDAGSYSINLLETIEQQLTNYEVTLHNGTLTVLKRAYSYDDIVSSDGTDGKTFAELIASGATFIYDGEGKQVNAVLPSDALQISIVYKDAQGNVVTGNPVNAGAYTVEVHVTVKDDHKASNYELPAGAQIQLVIEKAQITIVVADQTYDYNGTDHSSESLPENAYTITVNNGQTLTGGVTLTISQECINAGVYTDIILATHTYDESNYIVTIENGDITILKVDNVWETLLHVIERIVYDRNAVQAGEDFDAAAKFQDSGIQYTFYEKSGGEWVKLENAPTQVGDYAVQATVPGTDNYNVLESAIVPFSIVKRTITVNDLTFANGEFFYNGQPHSIYVTANEDILSVFNIRYEGNGEIHIGNYNVIATIELADEHNYEFTGESTMSANYTIKAVQVVITAINNSSAYGETIKELTYSITFNGDPNFAEFYAANFGSVVLSTTATNQSNVGTYDITVGCTPNSDYQVTLNNGTYTITKFEQNAIVDLTASDVRYLMELIYSANAKRGTVVFQFAESENGEYTSVQPKNVGTYYVKAIVEGTENYNGAVAVASFQITPATLSAITGITYNADTATWTAVVTTTDGKRVDCAVTYLVDGNHLTTPSFTATKACNFTVTAEPEDTHNYLSSEAVSLETVYSVNFADRVESHPKQQNLADLTDPAFATQYRFAGQAVTMPANAPVVVGYTFRAWKLDDDDYNFAMSVRSNLTLFADWTINSYTINFYNEVVTGSSIIDGIFEEGQITAELWKSYTVEFGTVFDLTAVDRPTKPNDEMYSYIFAYWADALRGNNLGDSVTVNGDMAIYAVYNTTGKQFTITYMLSIDGGAYEQYAVVTSPYGGALVTLNDVVWFIGDTWYTDANRQNSAPEFVPAQNMTLYGAYVFDIGAGDVNADGKVNTDDILNYRRWVVGGYDIITVEEGSEWDLVNSGAYNSGAIYYLVRVSDANRDESGDIRDITTIRMALTGGYGYAYVSGRYSAAGVTGEGVVFAGQDISNVSTPEELKAALEKGGFVQITGNMALSETITISNDTVISLNGYILDMSDNSTRPFAMANGATLTIYANNSIVKVGAYGLVDIPATADNVRVILHGGTYLAETDNGSFIKPRGTGKISIELYDVNLTDSSNKNYAIDASSYTGNALSVNVQGGTYNVWTGFVFDGPATNTFVLNNVTILSRYQGVTVGGDDSNNLPENAGHVTINNCTIKLQADLQKNTYSAEMACVTAGYGAQIEVNNSNLSSNIHIASICSGNGNSVIELNACTVTAGTTYEQYKFYDVGSIIVNGVDQAEKAE